MITKIILPFCVSVNNLYGGGSNQKRFPSAKYKKWLNSCPPLHPWNLECVEIEYRYYFPDDRVRDTANFVKCIDDFLVNQGVLIDDSWKHIRKQTLIGVGIDRKNPRVEIEIYQVTDQVRFSSSETLCKRNKQTSDTASESKTSDQKPLSPLNILRPVFRRK